MKALRDRGEVPLEWVNGLFSEHAAWRLTKGRHDREDFFGQKVQAHEQFYKRFAGGGYLQIELSKESFDRLCKALFAGNLVADQLAKRVLEIRREDEQNIGLRLREGETAGDASPTGGAKDASGKV